MKKQKFAWRSVAALLISIFLLLDITYADNTPPTRGNFALPTSQQPGPLMSLGQTVIDKNVTQLTLYTTFTRGVGSHFADFIPSVLYGITDNFSVMVGVPIAMSYKYDTEHSAGLEDTFLQLEYAFYTQSNELFTDQATFVTNISVPTGSTTKHPATGYGASNLLLGATFNRTYVDWLMFTSYGVRWVDSYDGGTQQGNQYFYQFGLGRNIANVDGWLLVGMLELNGQYDEKNKIQHVIDPDSGDSTLFVTPSLWVSSKQFIFQVGLGLPIVQNLHGAQQANRYLVATSISWTIY
jgi:hypothetical protein